MTDQQARAARALKYGDGPWLDEPDHVEFEHAGFLCVLHRQPSIGTWCGYVGVVEGHPWFEKHYDNVDADAHGGLTYSERGRGRLGQPDDAPHWFLGFDCAHVEDLMPQVAMLSPRHAEVNTYRDIAYVRRETERLARQAQAATLTRKPDEEQAP